MPIRHILVALLTVAVWGFNFVFIKLALHDMPPLMLTAARFLFTALPAAIFVPRPKIAPKLLIGYGLAIFAFQFGFLFCGMKLGMSAGLASMVMQTQVFFTIGFSALILHERPKFATILGALIAFAGVAVVGFHASNDVNVAGLCLLLLGASSWATGNVISKKIGAVNPIALVIWGGLVATPPLVILSLLVEGPAAITESVSHISLIGYASLAYIVYISTHLGFSLWAWLLRQYNASVVAPFTLLVPIFGFLGSWLFLHEQMQAWKLLAALLVVAGLCVNLFGSRRKAN